MINNNKLIFITFLFLKVSLAFSYNNSISVISPQTNVDWAAESKHYILWDNPISNTYKLEYSLDNGLNFINIVSETTSNEFLWTLPSVSPTVCQLRITNQTTSVSSIISFNIIATQKVDYEWTNITNNAAFPIMDGAGALTYNDKMFLIGGWFPNDPVNFPRICNNAVWSSLDGSSWILEKQNTFLNNNFDPTQDWEGRHTAGYVVYDDKMWIVGGDVNQGYYMYDVWNSNDGASWNYVNQGSPLPWGDRALHITTVFDNKIWVMGGQTITSFAPSINDALYNDIWNSTDGINWQQVSTSGPMWEPRGMIAGNVVLNDKMWILGGGTYNTPLHPERTYYNDVWSTSDGVNWTKELVKAPWNARQYHSVNVFDDRMWVAMGYNGDISGNMNDVWYSKDGINWYEVEQSPFQVTHAASFFNHDQSLWLMNGVGLQKQVWKLDRVCNSTLTVNKVFEENGWSYYAEQGSSDYLFAIEHNPFGGNTQAFTATVTFKNKNCPDFENILYKVNYSTKDAIFITNDYWNIEITSGSINGFVNVRFFNNQNFIPEMDNMANSFQISTSANYKSPAIHFGIQTNQNLFENIRSDAKGFNNAIFGFNSITIGSYSGTNYTQYNNINLNEISSGGILQQVTNRNEVNNPDFTILAGTIRFNPSTSKFQGYNGVQWVDFN